MADARALKARDWASDRFSAKTYVDALEPLLAAIGPHDILARTARHLATPVTTPGHAPMMVAVDAFAEVLDWMQGAQAGD